MNGYFQLDIRQDGTFLVVYKAKEGGKEVCFDEVYEYLIAIGMKTVDRDKIREILEMETDPAEGRISVLFREEQNERLQVEVSEDKMQAYGTLYAPSTNGETLSVNGALEQLTKARIRYGIKEDVISDALEKKLYGVSFLLAEGTEPVQGTDGRIEYYFETEKNLAPKLNEDGTVNYHDLNMISHIEAEQLLAKLYPDDPGQNGMNVMGEVLRPKKVKKCKLSYGNNIQISEDKTELYSLVTGHASLLNGKVFVSDIYEVPADVDNSTGDIDYEGSVEIKGNVNSGFTVRAGGDVIVGGVVEGARIEAKRKVIIRGGIHGMSKAVIYSGSSLTAKFIDNAVVYSDESVNADSIMHSSVSALCNVRVKGKKGFIAGGNIQAGICVETQTLGSEMGVLTLVEVGTDPQKRFRIKDLEDQIQSCKNEIARIEPTIVMAGKKIGKGEKFPVEKMQMIQQLSKNYQELKTNVKEYEAEHARLSGQLEASQRANILVNGDVYPGVTVVISEASKTMTEKRSSCKFIKEAGLVKII